ncbi:hypothetical protein JD969_00985 [Planctomycetota bacterium]|nr:hypothetical protein JD969_00985 [Planctomycetota bacterium]
MRLFILAAGLLFYISGIANAYDVQLTLPRTAVIESANQQGQTVLLELKSNAVTLKPGYQWTINSDGQAAVDVERGLYIFVYDSKYDKGIINLESKRLNVTRSGIKARFNSPLKVKTRIHLRDDDLIVKTFKIKSTISSDYHTWDVLARNGLPELLLTPGVKYDVLIEFKRDQMNLQYESKLSGTQFKNIKISSIDLTVIEDASERHEKHRSSRKQIMLKDSDERIQSIGERKSDDNPLTFFRRALIKVKPNISIDVGELEVSYIQVKSYKKPSYSKAKDDEKYTLSQHPNGIGLQKNTLYAVDIVGKLDGEFFHYVTSMKGEDLKYFEITRSDLKRNTVCLKKNKKYANSPRITIDLYSYKKTFSVDMEEELVFLTNRSFVDLGYAFIANKTRYEFMPISYDLRQQSNIEIGGACRGEVWVEAMMRRKFEGDTVEERKEVEHSVYSRLFIVDEEGRILTSVSKIDKVIEWELRDLEGYPIDLENMAKKWDLHQSVAGEIKAVVTDGASFVESGKIIVSEPVVFRSKHFRVHAPAFLGKNVCTYLAKLEESYEIFLKAKTPRQPQIIDVYFRKSSDSVFSYEYRGTQLVGLMEMPTSGLEYITSMFTPVSFSSKGLATIFGRPSSTNMPHFTSEGKKSFKQRGEQHKGNPNYIPRSYVYQQQLQ